MDRMNGLPPLSSHSILHNFIQGRKLQENLKNNNMSLNIQPTSLSPPIPHDIEKEITDLENLIKKLQKEITEMTEMADKPLEDYLPYQVSEAKKITEKNHNNLTYSECEKDNINKNVDDVKRSLKMLWGEPNPATTSDIPNSDENDSTVVHEDVKIVNNKNKQEVEDKFNNAENVHILRDFIAANKESQSDLQESDNNDEISNNSLDEKITEPIKKEELKTTGDKKPQSTIRLGILMHIFGNRLKGGEKEELTSKPKEIVTKTSKVEQIKKLSDSEESKTDIPLTTNNENTEITINNTHKSEVKVIEADQNKNDIVNSSDNSDDNTKDIEINKSSEKNGETSKNKFLHHSNKFSDTFIRPSTLNGPNNSNNKTPLTLDTNSLQNLKKRGSPPPYHHKASNKNVNIKLSIDHVKQNDTRLSDQTISTSKVPRTLSIINIYLDKPKPHVQNVPSKKQSISDVSITDSKSNLQIERSVSYVIDKNNDDNQRSKTLDRDFKTPSDSTSIASEKLEIPNTVKKVCKKKAKLINSNSSNNSSKKHSNPQLLDNALCKTNKSDVVQPLGIDVTISKDMIEKSEGNLIEPVLNDVLKDDKPSSSVNEITNAVMNSEEKTSATAPISKVVSIPELKDPREDSTDVEEEIIGTPSETITPNQVESIVISDENIELTVDSGQIAMTYNFLTKEVCNQANLAIPSNIAKDDILKDEITSTDLANSSEDGSVLTEKKSMGNVSYENEDLTDEYESIADDNDSLTDESVSGDQRIIIEKNEITINNGDDFSDVYEDSQDFTRDTAAEIISKPSKKKGI